MIDPRAAAPLRGSSDAAGRPTAGSLLRAAREAQRLDVAALAAAVKVPPRKVQALEADRYTDLPDVAFARGLAKSLCRVLGIDAQPVLALLPVLPDIGPGLEQVHNGLNTPVREQLRMQSSNGSFQAGALGRPAVWVPLVLLLGALALYVLPQGWIARTRTPAVDAAATADAPPAADQATSAADSNAPPPALVETGPIYPPAAGAAVSAATPTPPPAPLLQVDATTDSWVEVIDVTGAKLLQRTIRAGETVTLDGAPPLKVKVANAKGVTLALRGQPVDLQTSTRNNVARLELK